jgi:hypothetical protein
MAIEQKRRVFDEDCVGVVRKTGQPDDLKTRLSQRCLVRIVLRGCLGCIDWQPFQVREFAFGEPWAHGTGEGSGHP